MEDNNYIQNKENVQRDYILLRAKTLDPDDPAAIRLLFRDAQEFYGFKQREFESDFIAIQAAAALRNVAVATSDIKDAIKILSQRQGVLIYENNYGVQTLDYGIGKLNSSTVGTLGTYQTGEKGGLIATTFNTLQARNIEKLGQYSDVTALNTQIRMTSNAQALEMYAQQNKWVPVRQYKYSLTNTQRTRDTQTEEFIQGTRGLAIEVVDGVLNLPLQKVPNGKPLCYYPTYDTVGPDMIAVTVISNILVQQDQQNKIIDDESYLKWLAIGKQYYSNGSAAGQMGRLKQVNAIHNEYSSQQLLPGLGDRMIKLNDIMRSGIQPPDCLSNYFQYSSIKHYFRHEIGVLLEMANSLADDKELEENTQERVAYVATKSRRLWNINPDSKCGLFYNVDLKNSELPGESIIAIADQIMYLIADALKRNLSHDEMNQLFQNFILYKFKPKKEVVTKEDIFQKTRNYTAASVSTCFLTATVAAITDRYDEFKKHGDDYKVHRVGDRINLDTAVADSFLSHFDPTSGEIQYLVSDLLTELFTQPNKYYIGYFSDNLYLSFVHEETPNKVEFWSLDAAKMEASHSQTSLEAMRKIFIKNAGIGGSEVEQIYNYLFEVQYKNPKALWGKHIVPVKGLPSGVPGTSTCNSFLMRQVVVLVFQWLNKVDDSMELLPEAEDYLEARMHSKGFETDLNFTQIRLKYNTMGKMLKATIDPTCGLVGFLATAVGIRLTKESSSFPAQELQGEGFTRLDLLGMDGLVVTVKENQEVKKITLATLRDTSLMKGILFDKNQNSGKLPDLKQEYEVRISKYLSLYYFGGHSARYGYSQILRALCERMVLKNGGVEWKQNLVDQILTQTLSVDFYMDYLQIQKANMQPNKMLQIMAPKNFIAKVDFAPSHFVVDLDLQNAVMEEADMKSRDRTTATPTYTTLTLSRQEIAQSLDKIRMYDFSNIKLVEAQVNGAYMNLQQDIALRKAQKDIVYILEMAQTAIHTKVYEGPKNAKVKLVLTRVLKNIGDTGDMLNVNNFAETYKNFVLLMTLLSEANQKGHLVNIITRTSLDVHIPLSATWDEFFTGYSQLLDATLHRYACYQMSFPKTETYKGTIYRAAIDYQFSKYNQRQEGKVERQNVESINKKLQIGGALPPSVKRKLRKEKREQQQWQVKSKPQPQNSYLKNQEKQQEVEESLFFQVNSKETICFAEAHTFILYYAPMFIQDGDNITAKPLAINQVIRRQLIAKSLADLVKLPPGAAADPSVQDKLNSIFKANKMLLALKGESTTVFNTPLSRFMFSRPTQQDYQSITKLVKDLKTTPEVLRQQLIRVSRYMNLNTMDRSQFDKLRISAQSLTGKQLYNVAIASSQFKTSRGVEVPASFTQFIDAVWQQQAMSSLTGANPVMDWLVQNTGLSTNKDSYAPPLGLLATSITYGTLVLPRQITVDKLFDKDNEYIESIFNCKFQEPGRVWPSVVCQEIARANHLIYHGVPLMHVMDTIQFTEQDLKDQELVKFLTSTGYYITLAQKEDQSNNPKKQQRLCRYALQQIVQLNCRTGATGIKGVPNPATMFYKYRPSYLKYNGILEDYWIGSGHTTSSWEGHINTLREQLEQQNTTKYIAHVRKLLKNVLYVNESTTLATLYAFTSKRGFGNPDTSVPSSMPRLSRLLILEILNNRGIKQGDQNLKVTMQQMYSLNQMTEAEIMKGLKVKGKPTAQEVAQGVTEFNKDTYLTLDTLQLTKPVAAFLNAVIEPFAGYKVAPSPQADLVINLEGVGVYNYLIQMTLMNQLTQSNIQMTEDISNLYRKIAQTVAAIVGTRTSATQIKAQDRIIDQESKVEQAEAEEEKRNNLFEGDDPDEPPQLNEGEAELQEPLEEDPNQELLVDELQDPDAVVPLFEAQEE